MIFLNNAFTTAVKPERVKSAPPADAETAKAKLAELFHMKKPENIIFTHDEFQAMDIVLRSLIGPGDHVISTVMEQSSTVSVLDDLAAEGAEVTYIGVNSYGRLKYEDIEGAIPDPVDLNPFDEWSPIGPEEGSAYVWEPMVENNEETENVEGEGK